MSGRHWSLVSGCAHSPDIWPQDSCSFHQTWPQSGGCSIWRELQGKCHTTCPTVTKLWSIAAFLDQVPSFRSLSVALSVQALWHPLPGSQGIRKTWSRGLPQPVSTLISSISPSPALDPQNFLWATSSMLLPDSRSSHFHRFSLLSNPNG